MFLLCDKRIPGAALKKIAIPDLKGIRGRAAAMRITLPSIDILVIALYLPPRWKENAGTRWAVVRIIHWTKCLVGALAARCIPMLVMDGNIKVGLEKTAMGQWKPSSSPAIGDKQPERAGERPTKRPPQPQPQALAPLGRPSPFPAAR